MKRVILFALCLAACGTGFAVPEEPIDASNDVEEDSAVDVVEAGGVVDADDVVDAHVKDVSVQDVKSDVYDGGCHHHKEVWEQE